MGKQNPNHLVVLLHGIRNSGTIMKPFEVALKKEGYDVLNISYESTQKPIEELVEDVRSEMDTFGIDGYDQVNFVGHSMGGVLIRELLRDHNSRPDNLGNVVMFGSPHGGSQAADELKDWKLFQYIYGPAGQQLTTEFQKKSQEGLVVDYKLGVIASADNTGHFLVRSLIPGDNDGIVSVESTMLDGMDDHVLIDAPHSLMPLVPEVIRQAIEFLQNGKFDTRQRVSVQHFRKLFIK